MTDKIYSLRVTAVSNPLLGSRGWAPGLYISRYRTPVEDNHGPCGDWSHRAVTLDKASGYDSWDAADAAVQGFYRSVKGVAVEICTLAVVAPVTKSAEASDDALSDMTRDQVVEAYRDLREHHVSETTALVDRHNRHRTWTREALRSLTDDVYAKVAEVCRKTSGPCFCGAHITGV